MYTDFYTDRSATHLRAWRYPVIHIRNSEKLPVHCMPTLLQEYTDIL